VTRVSSRHTSSAMEAPAPPAIYDTTSTSGRFVLIETGPCRAPAGTPSRTWSPPGTAHPRRPGKPGVDLGGLAQRDHPADRAVLTGAGPRSGSTPPAGCAVPRWRRCRARIRRPGAVRCAPSINGVAAALGSAADVAAALGGHVARPLGSGLGRTRHVDVDELPTGGAFNAGVVQLGAQWSIMNASVAPPEPPQSTQTRNRRISFLPQRVERIGAKRGGLRGSLRCRTSWGRSGGGRLRCRMLRGRSGDGVCGGPPGGGLP